ncbi:1,2-phenylacetyl-CoA epoxidase subunit PaaC [Azohydromonas aeria]|uniref:1,2-phenylacetyl-CoA epoxidase subunit PaaC n=1 Tax=Azohydromonas aeria TaxID=2590212 RepID=UPI0012FC45F6|nr:1,2-phenylacetyl-CoA epoxidase subunit PaaC [Azohydromonas aeria]
MQASIQLQRDARQQYLLRIGDTCLISAQRLSEWTGHAPVLEEDIALANMALDLLGQARAVLTLAGAPQGLDEDQLAFLREERDYFNPTLVELPNGDGRPGDFALTVLRNAFVSTLLKLLWQRLQDSADEELAAIAAKALKEARYHQEHAADWVLRLGDGTDESHRRMQAALDKLWPFVAELFAADAVDAAAAESGLGPAWAELREEWMAEVVPLLQAATLQPPDDKPFRSTGRQGVHSEHMGYILAEMQHLQRAYPGGAW